ncbi:MAG TPA: AAA family ATPase [Bacteroidales bacterium]|nr:AAA family ATPase [Bacteroidales bacterium]
MERLYNISNSLLSRVSMDFKRYLFNKIDWDAQLIAISGARGCGKTVMLLQYLKSINAKKNALYVSLDDIYFSENKLILFAEQFFKKGGEVLLLDEVHKYPNWSQEIKNIYDTLQDLQIVFTGSSALEIHKGAHDLSRRAVVYNLAGMSFREYLELKHKIKLPAYELKDILLTDNRINKTIVDKIKPLQVFDEYLQKGYYPFFFNTKQNYLKQLLNTVNLVIESDLPSIYNIEFSSTIKIKKLLSIISRIVPYKPNIEELARQIGTTRDTLLKYMYYLEKAQIIKWLGKDTMGINYLNKPEKLYLNNTNINYALTDLPNQGNIRETFFLNQISAKHFVSYPSQGDFFVDGKYVFEIGGKNKSKKQILNLADSYIVADDIEYSFENKIPLWLFGFLY